jgi:putative oxidoreductase
MKAALALLLRIVLGVLLLVAGMLKIRAPTEFASEIANYQLFPGIAPYLAATLPATELLLGAGLLVFPRVWRRAATVGALALLTTFAGAVGSAYFRHINIDCGCFGAGGGPITILTLLRNLLLIGAGAFLLHFDDPAVSQSDR